MSTGWDDRMSRLEGLLSSAAGKVESGGPGWWSLTDGNGSLRRVDVRMVDDWLRFETTPDSDLDGCGPWQLLRRTGSLDPATKLVVPVADSGAVLCADLPVRAGLEGGALATIVAQLGVETSAGKHKAGDGREGGASSPASDELVDMCREAGWDATEKGDDTIRVDCTIRGSTRSFRLEPASESEAFRVVADLVDLESPSPAVRDAVAVLLLTLSDVVWGLRGFAGESGDRMTAGIETVVWGESADAVGDAVAAVAFGCDLAADESMALGNDAVAKKYLELRGMPAQLDETGAGRAS
jgi:hypothetical protein